jgi:aspartyl aminopeptidase
MKTVWDNLKKKDRKELEELSKEYAAFMSAHKTEREFTEGARQMAEKAGYQDLHAVKKFKAGDKLYAINRNKNIILFNMGRKPLTEGMNILGAHIDSPRLDLKQHPLYEKDGLALFDTHYYGGIKKYQWTTRPMALHGVVCRKDGTAVNVVIGEDDDDPVFGVTEILVHLAQEQMKKDSAHVVEGEDLDLLVGSIPNGEGKDPVKANILALLKEKYNIEEDDFMSAELEVVPAGKMREFGLDRSMLMGYGQDDKVCAYTSLKAILDTEKPERTSCCILVDKEEIGSVGNTGMQSHFFQHVVARLLDMEGHDKLVDLNDAIENSRMLSSDVSAAVDPLYDSVFSRNNSAHLGGGICYNKYTGARGKSGSNDANAEYFAKVRKVMDDNHVIFQTCELGAVDKGGGGTIAYILANLNMDVVDAGIAVENMHSPAEIVSKADVYEGYRAYKAFLKDMQ